MPLFLVHGFIGYLLNNEKRFFIWYITRYNIFLVYFFLDILKNMI